MRSASDPFWGTDRGIRLSIRRDLLRKARHAAGLTQEQAAHLAGITVGTFCKIENGIHREVNARTVAALEELLEVDLRAEGLTPAKRREIDQLARYAAGQIRLAAAEEGRRHV